MRARLPVLLAAIGLLSAASSGAAQQNWSKLNDWRVVCDPSRNCQINNEVSRGGETISHIYIYKVGQAEVIEYRVPLGVDLRKGVALRVDRRQRFATQMLNCKADGCVGFVTMSTTILKALAAGEELELVYNDYDADREVSVTYSLVGFVRSYNTFYEQ